jgi:hypothetical protein
LALTELSEYRTGKGRPAAAVASHLTLPEIAADRHAIGAKQTA